MFQNQIFQVKCFNLEIFEIFQTCPVWDYKGHREPSFQPQRATGGPRATGCL